MTEESKQRLIQTVRYGLTSEIIQIIFSFAVRNNKTSTIKEMGDWMNNFFASLSKEEEEECREEVMELVKEKEDKFRRELSEKMSEVEIDEILEMVKVENIFSQSN